MTWPYSLTNLQQFISYLNKIIPDITLTPTFHGQHINFLDLTFFKFQFNENTYLQDRINFKYTRTGIYFKDIHTHEFLHGHSYHPRHTSQSILYSQLLRFKRLSDTYIDHCSASSTMFNIIKKCGYNLRCCRTMRRTIWPLNGILASTRPKTLPDCEIAIKKSYP